MKGRKPTPTALKVLQGNPGRRPINKREPKPRKSVRCPGWLSPKAKAEWQRLAPELLRLGLLTMVDQSAFAMFCTAVAEVQLAQENIRGNGRTYQVDDLMKPNPAVGQLKAFMQEARAWGALFGLTPADRSRLEVSTDEDDDLDELLFGIMRPAANEGGPTE